MQLDRIAGNAPVVTRLKRALSEGPTHAYLFVGPAGVGKTTTALAFAADLLEAAGSPPLRNAHPDLWLEDSDSESISIDIIRAAGPQTLQGFLSLRGMYSDRRVAVMARAERLSEAAAPPLLKTIEEPPRGAVLILCAEAVELLPETIRSRCQQIEFQRIADEQIQGFLVERGLGVEMDIIRIAAGCPGRALQLAGDPETIERSREWGRIFATVPGMSWLDLVSIGARFASGDFRRNRELAREAMDVWESCIRDVLLLRSGAGTVARGAIDHALLADASVSDLAGLWASAQEARDRLTNNVNPRLVVEAFLAEVANGKARQPEATDYFLTGVFKSVALP